MGPVPALPLPTLLSQVLVAHTIEIDNEAEHRLPHRTTRGDPSASSTRHAPPWLVSFALWANVLQHLDDDGVDVAELRRRARTSQLLLGGLRRWGYVSLRPPDGEALRNPPQDDAVVRLRTAGRQAGTVWSSVPTDVDARWRDRFGTSPFDALVVALGSLFARLTIAPPAFLPVVHPTQNGKAEPPPPADPDAAAPPLDLSALLSGVLLAFTLDVERTSRIALPIGANTLRVLDTTGVTLRDLPRLTGVSKEATAMCAGWLQRRGCVVVEPDAATGRGKVLRLTAKGEHAQSNFRRSLGATEESWRAAFGARAVDDLRAACTYLVGDGMLARAPLAGGLEPYPDNWRAAIRSRPDTLPHYPMVLHRGGYPDGS